MIHGIWLRNSHDAGFAGDALEYRALEHDAAAIATAISERYRHHFCQSMDAKQGSAERRKERGERGERKA